MEGIDLKKVMALMHSDTGGDEGRPDVHQLVTPTSEGVVSVHGQTLYYCIWGTGTQILVSIPGSLGVGEMDFIPLVKDVPQGVSLVTFHLRGCGKSKPPNRTYPLNYLQQDADDCANMMEQLGFEQYSVLGWCSGGISAMMLAADHPKSVKNLILLGCRSFISQEDIGRYRNLAEIAKFNPLIMRDLIKVHGDAATAQEVWSSNLSTLFEIFDRGGDLCKSKLPMIQCPTVILQGQHDIVVVPSHGQYLHDHIKGSSLYKISEGRHALSFQFSAKILRLIQAFLTDGTLIPWDDL